MAEGTIRINKVLKDFNIGLSTLTDFLKKIGCDTAKSVLALSTEEVMQRADLEEETVLDSSRWSPRSSARSSSSRSSRAK